MAEIAVASVGNALIELKNEDEEMFEMVEIRKIIFFVYGPDGADGDEVKKYEKIIKKLLEDVQLILSQNRIVVYHTSWQLLLRYRQEMIQMILKRCIS